MSAIRMVKSPQYSLENSALKQTVKPSQDVDVETKVYEAKAPNLEKDSETPNPHYIDDGAIAL